MAKTKKNPLPLSARIENFTLEVDAPALPTKQVFMNRLMEWIPLAQALENGEALAEAKGETAALAEENAGLYEQNAALKEQIKALETENKDFKALLNQANGEISRIREEAKNAKQQKPVELPEEVVRILVQLADEEAPKNGYTLAQLAFTLEPLNELTIHHYLDKMNDAELVMPQSYTDGTVRWLLIRKGRDYIVEKGLIQKATVAKAPLGKAHKEIVVLKESIEKLRGEIGLFAKAKKQWGIQDANQKEQIETLRKEIDRLAQAQHPQSSDVPEEQIRLLIYLIGQGPQNRLSEEVIAGGARISPQAIHYQLKELAERGFITGGMIPYSHPPQYRWNASHEGEKWAKAQGLIRD